MMTAGAAPVMRAATTAIAAEAVVSSRLTSSSPLRLRRAVTIWGTRIALRTPPIMRL